MTVFCVDPPKDRATKPRGFFLLRAVFDSSPNPWDARTPPPPLWFHPPYIRLNSYEDPWKNPGKSTIVEVAHGAEIVTLAGTCGVEVGTLACAHTFIRCHATSPEVRMNIRISFHVLPTRPERLRQPERWLWIVIHLLHTLPKSCQLLSTSGNSSFTRQYTTSEYPAEY